VSLLPPSPAARRLREAARARAAGRLGREDYRRLRARVLEGMLHGEETTRSWRGEEDDTETRPGAAGALPPASEAPRERGLLLPLVGGLAFLLLVLLVLALA
jgi:hypothetical protein